MRLRLISVRIDLNSALAQPMLSQSLREGAANEFWQINLFSTNGLSAFSRISPVRRSLSWRLQAPKLFMLVSISLHGVCATYLQRESARYRGLPACSPIEALSYGHSRSRLAQHSCKCKY